MNKQSPKPAEEHVVEVPAKEPAVCGIVMPISAMGDYDEAHWLRVRRILDRAIEAADFKPRMVSESEEIAVIQESIVQNLYENDIAVVDVSGKNPNVMFELGLRLAFDKPTVIIKDDATSYNFDTSPIKHIGYRRDLRFDDVERLQTEVTAAIKATLAKKAADENYSPFLKTFGKFKIAQLETKEVTESEFLAARLASIEDRLVSLSHTLSLVRMSDANPSERVRNAQTLTKNTLSTVIDETLAMWSPLLKNDSDLGDFVKDITERMKHRGLSVSREVVHDAVKQRLSKPDIFS
ncbi:hypothetical protein PYH37_004969 [Sinorhizobium numidicum]|uniref:RNA helicase n=1 Tax=Sinorhizobium numidicum TaxID=680248 RepID=A0ABY8CXF1_9HYPH|nr:hypothetical protein [Sinorhizobium numidicum]WEX76649.1 hypothetical protein PYH37_004969 [Sinorhizobium numidicum]WEX83310.1 hypothetical protein PYH38_005681 [Sinorhizobium numidicum]